MNQTVTIRFELITVIKKLSENFSLENFWRSERTRCNEQDRTSEENIYREKTEQSKHTYAVLS